VRVPGPNRGLLVDDIFISELGSGRTASLTVREIEVLRLVAEGNSGKEIAQKLAIASTTVEAYVNHLKLKLRAKNRAHLVAVALEAGMLLPEPTQCIAS
jgi:DNA-binding CsgD family transcriptional regulator